MQWDLIKSGPLHSLRKLVIYVIFHGKELRKLTLMGAFVLSMKLTTSLVLLFRSTIRIAEIVTRNLMLGV